jgi:acetyl-CoA synthetase
MSSKAILDMRSYREAVRDFRWGALWKIFDGNRERLNLAHECVDRHAGPATALRLQFADGRREEHTFDELRLWSSRFANFLEREGIGRGDRVAIMLEPSLAFYAAVFGTLKRGAVVVPLFTLFGPEGLALRVNDCRPRLLLVPEGQAGLQQRFANIPVVPVDRRFMDRLGDQKGEYTPSTRADDLAVLQYTSGTTRELPAAVRHTHRSVVTLMVAALYGIGLRPGDRYFCPSSPAWGHGLWHGTIAPLALGVAVGAYSGRFDPERLLEALEAFRITNLAAAPTVYRLVRSCGRAKHFRIELEKLSFTGEPMDGNTWDFLAATFGVTPRSMYGTTEVGVIIVNYPGFPDYEVRSGALGMAAPGWEVAILGEDGQPAAPGQTGEIAVKRRGAWFLVKDRGSRDADGFFYHAGRSDDVIISAGWTMSAMEIETVLLLHPDVREAAVIAVPDEVRGHVPKALVIADAVRPQLTQELQEFVKARLSQHEYPRVIEFVDELPKTPAGKISRRALRERERGRAPAGTVPPGEGASSS